MYQPTFSMEHSPAPPKWLSGERIGLMTWWLRVEDPVKAKFFSAEFSPLTFAEACEKSSQWLWKEICVSSGARKPGNIHVTDCHDMTLAVKSGIKPQYNQPTSNIHPFLRRGVIISP